MATLEERIKNAQASRVTSTPTSTNNNISERIKEAQASRVTSTPTSTNQTTKKTLFPTNEEVIAERAQRSRDTWVQEDTFGKARKERDEYTEAGRTLYERQQKQKRSTTNQYNSGSAQKILQDNQKREKYDALSNDERREYYYRLGKNGQEDADRYLLSNRKTYKRETKPVEELPEDYDTYTDYAESGLTLHERMQQKKKNQQEASGFSTEAGENQSVQEIRLGAMTNDERQMYYYQLAKGGQEAADNYLQNISPQLNARLAAQEAQEIRSMPSGIGKALRYGAQSVMAGVDQASKGIAQALTGNVYDNSQTAITSGMIGSELSGLKRSAYNAGVSIGNMLPAVTVSLLTNGAGAPALLANAASGLTTALGSGGNAYGEAIKEGYDETAARTYGTLIGASEAAIGEIIGGVSALAGQGISLTEKLVSKVSGIENGLARWALSQGIRIGAEVNEEEVQNFLEPLFRTVIFGEDYDAPTIQELVDTAITTAISTGIMNFGQSTPYNPTYDAEATATDRAMMDTLAGRETAENPNVTQETDLDRVMQQTFAETKYKDVESVAARYGLSESTAKNVLEIVNGWDITGKNKDVLQNLAKSDAAKAAIRELSGVEVEGNLASSRKAIKDIWAAKRPKTEVSTEVEEAETSAPEERTEAEEPPVSTSPVEVRAYFNNVNGKNGYYLIQDGRLVTRGFFDTERQAQNVADAINTRNATLAERQRVQAEATQAEPERVDTKNESQPPISRADAAIEAVGGKQQETVAAQRKPTAESRAAAAEAGFDPYSHALNEYGAIEAGENPARVVDVPKSVDGKKKVSKFARTAMEASITTDEMVSRIEQLVVDGKLDHNVYTDKQAIQDGTAAVVHDYERGKSVEQIRSEFIRDAERGKAGKKLVAKGLALYADAVADNDYRAAADILVGLTAIETNAGQTVQAARLLKSQTPEGRVFTAQKMVSNIEAQINKGRSVDKQIEIDLPDNLLEAYKNAKTQESMDAAMGDIYDYVAEQYPTSLSEALTQWRYFSMLFNPSTHAKNIIGNFGGLIAKIGKDNLAALGEEITLGDVEKKKTKAAENVVKEYGLSEDLARNVSEVVYGTELTGDKNHVLSTLARSKEARKAISDLSGTEISESHARAEINEVWKVNQEKQAKRGRTKAFLNPMKKSDQELIAMAWNDYDTATELFDKGSKYGRDMGEINSRRRYWKINDPKTKAGEVTNAVLGTLEGLNDLNSKALEVEDMWFSKPQYTAALAGYMKANHQTEITDAARTYAMTEAKRGTFNDLNTVSRWATNLGGDSKLGKLIAGIAYPFKKVPANVMVRTVEYSPLGLLKGGYELLNLKKNPDITAAQVIDTFAASASGSALMGIGYLLAKAGILRATGLGDEKEREQQKKAFGAKDFSFITSDGRFIPIDVFTLAGTSLLTGAQLFESIQNMKNGDEIDLASVLDALSKITDPVFEQSMLTGISDIIRTIQYSGTDTDNGELAVKVGIQMAGNYLGQYVPTLIGRIASSLDEYQRTSYVEPDGAWSPIQTAAQTIQKKIPWAREDMMATRGNWGVLQEGNAAGGFLSAVGKAVTPIYTSESKTDPVEEEIARLYKADNEYSNFYVKPSKSISVNGETVKLTSEQYDSYVERDGQVDYNIRNAMLSDEVYQNVPDSVKSKAMEFSAQYANELGKVSAGVGYQIKDQWVKDLVGKSDEEIANALLKKAALSVGGIAKYSETPHFNATEVAGMDAEVVDKVMAQANTYADWVALERMGYDVSDAPEWVREVTIAKNEQEELLADGKELEEGTVTWKDMLVQIAVESAAKANGKNKYDGLSNMLDSGDITDATALLVVPSDAREKYEKTSAGHISVSQLVETVGLKNAAKDEHGNFSRDIFVQSLNDTGWTSEEKAYAWLTQYKEITDMPTEWYEGLPKDILTDYTRLDKKSMPITSEDAAARYKTSGATSYLDAAKFAEAANKSMEFKTEKDENGKDIDGSKAKQFANWLDTTGWSATEKATAYATIFKTNNMPEGYYSSIPNTMVKSLLDKDQAEKWDSTKADADKMKVGLKYYDTLTSDKDKNGNTITNSKMKKFRQKIAEQNWTQAEKRAVFCTFYSSKNSWW